MIALAQDAPAACASADPRLFTSLNAADHQAARRYCHACPVIDDCVRLALKTGDATGTWAGRLFREGRLVT